MQSKVSRIIKVLAIIIWIGGFIAGIVMGTTGSIIERDGEFNFWTMLVYWITFFVAGVFYYAFGELVENVASARAETSERLDRMTDLMARMLTLMESKGAATQPAPPLPQSSAPAVPTIDMPSHNTGTDDRLSYRKSDMEHPTPEKIICPKCGREQLANRNVCFNCGSQFIS